MRSIPAAMTWEMLAHGRWSLAAAALGALVFPMLILLALRQDGALVPQDSSILILHVIIVQINAILFGSAVFAASEPMSLLYAYPARTSTLVAWRLIPAMALMGMETALCMAALNAIFNLDWPLWGPALFVAVAYAAVMAANWLTQRSLLWQILALALVAVVFGLWLKARYGPMFAQPTHLWHELTTGQTFAMLSAAAASYAVAVVAVARHRRGEPAFSLGVVDWLVRQFSPVSLAGASWTTPAKAQSWFHWRQYGWAMPVVVAICLAIGLIVWLSVSRASADLMNAFVGAGGMFWLVGGMGGLMMGNMGSSESSLAVGNFLATRPITDAGLSRAILRTAAASLLLAWLLWAIPFAISYAILLIAGQGSALDFPLGAVAWYVPATILGPWIALGMTTSIGLVGRPRLVLQMVFGSFAAFIAYAVFAKFALSRETQEFWDRTLLAAVSCGVVLGTGWLFAAAHRRSFIGTATVWSAASFWAVALALAVVQLPPHVAHSPSAYAIAASLMALSVAPIAAAPIAVSWNRHR